MDRSESLIDYCDGAAGGEGDGTLTMRGVEHKGHEKLTLLEVVLRVQGELEQAYRASSVDQLSEEDRAKIVRFRLKPDVMRGDRQVIRLEVAGPEGFMIGFDQDK